MIDAGQVVLGIIAVSGVALSAILGWFGTRGTTAAKTVEVALQQLNERVTNQGKEIAELRGRLEQSESERHQLSATIQVQAGELRDKDELLADYRKNVCDWMEHWARGSKPPAPTMTWRMRNDLIDLGLIPEEGA